MDTNRYGWKRDIPDIRDFKLTLAPNTPLPASTDLRAGMPEVWDQGDLGSCSAHAVCAGVVFDWKKESKPVFMPSRLFLYYEERVLEHTVKSDSGAYLRDGMKVLNKKGICPEDLYPYNINKFTLKPSKNAYNQALKHKSVTYQAVNQIEYDLKKCLADGYPVIFGFSVYESFESDAVAKTGIVPMPSQSEQLLGGHAVILVGYDDNTRRFLVRNSWGANWGVAGYFWLPYDYVLNKDLAADFWVLKFIN